MKKKPATRGERLRAEVGETFDLSQASPAWRALLDETCRAIDVVEKLEQSAEPSRVELVSSDLCGATSIHLSVVTLGPGIRDEPHWHVMGEKVMYVTEGRGEIVCGVDLATVHTVERGDAVYVPPFAVHAPRNASSKPFTFVMVANAPMDVSVPG